MDTPTRSTQSVDRRTWLLAAAGACTAPGLLGAAEPASPHICAFVKGVQELGYEELARQMAELGFAGIEATVRRGGHVDPERVEEQLPRLVEALDKHGLVVSIMTTDVNDARDPLAQRVLRAAASLGARRYRMKYYTYDLGRSVTEQLEALKPRVAELAELNRELGVVALYQNHSGAKTVGASVWDLRELFEQAPPEQVALAFDIRHATVEGGLSWPVLFNVARERLGAVYFKDFQWQGAKPVNTPLGEGRVDPRFARMLRATGFEGPISLHVEYLLDRGVEENLAALRADLATLRRWWSA